ncbi:YceI family protein [Patescibacteria group bacterium]|nr:YceI family protein [Patescibacteria group bacterium]
MKKIVLIIIVVIAAILIIKSMKGREEPLPRNDLQEDADYQVTSELSDGTYAVSAGSQIAWEGKAIGKSHPGGLSVSSGTLVVEDGLISGSIAFDMASITSDEGISMLEEDLKSDNFFDVVNYPEATFSIKSYLNGAISGDLTMRGITQPVSIPTTVTMGDDESLVVTFNGSLDRTLWDIRFRSNSFFDDLGDKAINDQIEVSGTLKAITAA